MSLLHYPCAWGRPWGRGYLWIWLGSNWASVGYRGVFHGLLGDLFCSDIRKKIGTPFWSGSVDHWIVVRVSSLFINIIKKSLMLIPFGLIGLAPMRYATSTCSFKILLTVLTCSFRVLRSSQISLRLLCHLAAISHPHHLGLSYPILKATHSRI